MRGSTEVSSAGGGKSRTPNRRDKVKLLIMADIHGNREALRAVLADVAKSLEIDACALLGDLIDYGMHSNEVISMIRRLPYPLACNLWGNHEAAIVNAEYGGFSSDRGRASAAFTRSALSEDSMEYVRREMLGTGKSRFEIDGRRYLAVHGSLEDMYWKSVSPETDPTDYGEYSVVLSGHSHLPHFFEKYIPADNPRTRNRKKIIFINPGSVGQPRNQNPMAQYAVLDTDTEEVRLCKASYDVELEQSAYHGQVDDFYRERLGLGI